MLTFADLIDHAVAYLGGDAATPNVDRARRAVVAAYTDLPTRHNWSYYRGVFRINTVAAYGTGTIEFDLTGGASERLVTLTGGTFPAWAASGVLNVGGEPYEVQTRLSGTTLILKALNCPAADIAPLTQYTLYRDTYPLPDGFLSMARATLGQSWYNVTFLSSAAWANLRRRQDGPSTPYTLCITGSGEPGAGMSLRMWPPPDAAYLVSFEYRRAARRLLIDRRDQGTAVAASGDVTVSGSNTAFTAAMVGSVVRLGEDSNNRPTGFDGPYPPAQERVIATVESALTLTVTEPFTADLDGVRVVVSDPVDIDGDIVGRLMLREVERQCRLLARMDPTADESRQYQMAVTHAREADARVHSTADSLGGRAQAWRLSDYPASADMLG